jgi:hypothetical protein
VSIRSRSFAAIACCALAVACAHAPGAPTRPWPAECGAPIEGLAPLLAPGHALVLGEVHGTREVAEFAASAVCAAAHTGPVVLGLEMPAQPQFAAYLASDGGGQAQQALLSAPFWNAVFQDGRATVAALGLIDRVRVLAQQGLPVELLLFDASAKDGRERDRLMAQNISAHQSLHPKSTYVFVMGNLHARKTPGSSWQPDDGYQWLASLLHLPVVSLDAGHGDGTAWICLSQKPEECGPKVVSARETTGQREVRLAPSKDGAYDGIFDVVTFTASPPAAQPEKAAGLDEKIRALLIGPEMTVARGRRAASKGDFAGCTKLLASLPAPSAGVLYDRACCESQMGELDAAFESLRRALAAGFNDQKTLETDTDLANLRKDPRWSSLQKP